MSYTIKDVYWFIASLVEGMEREAIFIIGKDKRFRLARGQALTKADFAPEQIEGEKYEDVLGGTPQGKLLISHYDRVLEGGWSECYFQDNDKDYHVSFWPLRTKKGGLLGGVAFTRDITKQKSTERELKHTADELINFTRAAAHDLKEPSRTISNYIQLIEEELELDQEPLKEWFHYIKEAAARNGRLIDALLTYSVATAKTLNWSLVDTQTLVENIIDDLSVLIDETDARIIAGNLPTIQANDMLPQVFQNLIINAIRYRKSTQRPQVKISAKRCRKQWKFCVADNGVGIPDNFQETVFEAFRRLDGARSGAGLGLALARRIIEAHQGKIWLTSKEGKGTQVYFLLPE